MICEANSIEGSSGEKNNLWNFFYVYIVKCNDNAYYVGHTDNIEQRLDDHNNQTFKGYTTKRLPVKLVYLEAFQTRDDAFICERRIKGWTRAKKEALIKEDWDQVSIFARKKFNQNKPS